MQEKIFYFTKVALRHYVMLNQMKSTANITSSAEERAAANQDVGCVALFHQVCFIAQYIPIQF
jgi:hypothetical protein